VLDLGSTESAGQNSSHYWPKILAQTKQNDQQCYCGGEINLQCTISLVILAARFSMHVAEHLFKV